MAFFWGPLIKREKADMGLSIIGVGLSMDAFAVHLQGTAGPALDAA